MTQQSSFAGAAGTADINPTPVPVGGAIRINTTLPDEQSDPAITVLADGSYVVAWQSFASGIANIYFQRYNAAGVAQGAETLVSATVSSYQAHPSLATLSDGSFVVVWESTTGSSGDIYSRRYDASGTPLAPEVRVNATIPGNQTVPDVAAIDGGYVVTWTSQATQIYSQRYTTAGVAQGSETLVDATTWARYGNVERLSDGGYVVVWSAQDQGDFGVYMRRYDAAGVASSAKVQVNTTTPGYQWFGEIAVLNDGSFVVAWTSHDPDDFLGDIYMRHYSASGVALTGEVRVNSDAAGNQQYVSISALATGGYVIAWQTDTGVYARSFDAADTAQGIEARLDTAPAAALAYPAIAGLKDGGFIGAWQSIGSGGTSWDVIAQRFGPTIQATEQVARDLKGMMSVTDLDGGSMTVHLSVDYGILAVDAGTSGVTVLDSGTGSVTLTGTAAQINALLSSDSSSLVSYTANGDAPPAGATLTLEVEGGTGDTAAIAIAAVNDAPAKVSASLTLLEGLSEYIDSSVLRYDDPEQGHGEIVYKITSISPNGTVTRDGGALSIGSTFTQTDVDNNRIRFAHDGGETTSASIGFTVSDGHGGVLSGQTLAITVTPVNDAPTVTDGTFSVSADEFHTLTFADFGFSDIEGNSFYQLWITQWPTGGQIMFVTDDGPIPMPVAQISASFIAQGRIRYVPNADAEGIGYDSFKFQVMDSGWAVSKEHVLTFDVTPGNQAPTQDTNTGLTLQEGGSATIGTAALSFQDSDQTHAQIVYTITSETAGTLRLDGVTLHAGGTFTQEDVDNDRLSYQHDGGESSSDSFGFTVSDGVGGTIAGQSFTLNIAGVDDAPVLHVLDAAPTFIHGAGAAVLDDDAAITDAELDLRDGIGNYAGATLTIARQGGADPSDAFGFDLTGAGFQVSGNSLQLKGMTFATFADSGGTFTISFTSSGVAASSGLVNDVLRHIAYSSSGNPGSVVLAYSFSDGNQGSQGSGGAGVATGSIAVTVKAPAAIADTASVLENATVTIDVLGNDLDLDGTSLLLGSVATIDGVAAQVGVPITLASGATATLHADGTIGYDPNGKYDALISSAKAAWSGSANASAVDSFTYSLGTGATGTVSVTVQGVDSASDAITGSSGSDVLNGLTGNDLFMAQNGGDDRLAGGLGDDTFYLGAAYTGGDTIRGGIGNDTLLLQGNYNLSFTPLSVLSVETLVLMTGSDTRYGGSGTERYTYSFDTTDSLVAAGAQLTVQGSRLLAGETLVFNGGFETDGSFRLIGGAGDDLLFGGAKDDMIVGGLGQDQLSGNGGNDWYFYRDAAESRSSSGTDVIHDFDAGDRIDLSSIDADTTHAGNDAFSFIGSDAFHHVAGELRAVLDNGSWSIEADLDGDGIADMQIIASAGNGHQFVASDFTL